MRISKMQARKRRHRRVRQRVIGTADCPRICVFRSNRHVSVQLVDDASGKTLTAVTTLSKDNAGKNSCNVEKAHEVGVELGNKMKELGIEKAVFDRSGYYYHGIIKAVADGVRSVDEENHFHF